MNGGQSISDDISSVIDTAVAGKKPICGNISERKQNARAVRQIKSFVTNTAFAATPMIPITIIAASGVDYGARESLQIIAINQQLSAGARLAPVSALPRRFIALPRRTETTRETHAFFTETSRRPHLSTHRGHGAIKTNTALISDDNETYAIQHGFACSRLFRSRLLRPVDRTDWRINVKHLYSDVATFARSVEHRTEGNETRFVPDLSL